MKKVIPQKTAFLPVCFEFPPNDAPIKSLRLIASNSPTKANVDKTTIAMTVSTMFIENYRSVLLIYFILMKSPKLGFMYYNRLVILIKDSEKNDKWGGP